MKSTSLPGRLAGLFRFTFLIGLLSAALVHVHGQTSTGAISGKVRDANGAPLAGALVQVPGAGVQVATDREGDFYLGSVPAGDHVVRITYLGLPARDENVVVRAGQRLTLQAVLGGGELIQLEAFTVSGQRAGQARALNLQRSSENLKEIVAADAIGRFPDQNAAETMQRLSGVALERDQGEGRFISIRGISADLNNTQIDGVNVPSSERGTRKVNLDTISSEQLDGIELTKALRPDLDGDAIGGSVNLKTKTAFSQDGRTLQVSAEGQYNSFAEKWGHKAALTAASRFGGDRWGLLVSLSDQRRYMTSLDNEQATGWALKNDFYVPNGNIDIREYHIRRVRQGASFSLDFHPAADDEFFLRGTYNHFSDTENRFRMLFAANAASSTPIDNNRGAVANRTITVDLKDRTEDTNIALVSTGGAHRRGAWKFDWLAARSHANLEDPYRFEPAFRSGNTNFGYDFTDQRQPVLSGAYQALPLTAYRVNAIRLRHAFSDDYETTLAANLRGDTQWGSLPGYWKTGVKYRLRKKTSDTEDNRFTDGTAGAFTLANVSRASTFNPGSTPFLTTDPKALDAYFRGNRNSFVRNNVQSAIGSLSEDYRSNEDVLAGYVMGSVTAGAMTLLGGVRVEQTEFNTKGWRTQGTAAPVFSAASAKNDYTNVLPSVHVLYRFNQNVQGRVALTQSISRPNFTDAAFRVSIDDNGNYSQGNVKLKPYQANNFDAALEFYPGRSVGVMSIGVFAKQIDDFIFGQTITGGAPNGINDLSTPLNGDRAKIIGGELTYQQQFTFLPSPLDGMGVFLNFTNSRSEADLGDARAGEKLAFLQHSKRIANFALSYEKHGFFIRASLNYRSSYLDSIGGAPSEDLFVDDHVQVDVTANYRFRRHITFYAEALNVTGEPYQSLYGVSGRSRKAEEYKWAANVGVRYRL